MEKRVVLAVVLTIGVIFLSNVLFPGPELPPAPPAAADSTAMVDGEVSADLDTTPRVGADEQTTLEGAEPGTELPDDAAEELPGQVVAEAPADTISVTTDLLELQFSTLGAALLSAEILEYESFTANGDGDRRAQLIRDGDRVFGFRVAMGGDTVRLDSRVFEVDRRELRVDEGNPRDSLVFRYPFPSGSAEFVVTYRFELDSYLVGVSGRVEGIGDRGYSVLTSMGLGLRTNEKDPADDYRQLGYVVRGQSGGIESVNLDKVSPGELRTAEGVRSTGWRSRTSTS